MSLGPLIFDYQPVKPMDWPQDKATPPNGFGGLGETAFNNRINVRQEGFIYGAESLSIAAGAIGAVTIPIQPDADFWCNQIIMQVDAAGATSYSPKVIITDIRTGYQLTYPYARLHNFQNLTSVNTTRIPTTGRLGATLLKPYCFTRNGGIGVEIRNATALNPGVFYIGFLGWKEYENVAR